MDDKPFNIGDLLPSAKEIQKAKVEGFVHSTLSRLAKDLGADPEVLRMIKSHAERYDVETFLADFPSFPWGLAVDRVENYSVVDLFERPTKSPVFLRFAEHFPDWDSSPTGHLMFFKAQGFTTLVIGTANAFDDCSIFLTVKVRKSSFFVTTYAEFVDAVRNRGILET